MKEVERILVPKNRVIHIDRADESSLEDAPRIKRKGSSIRRRSVNAGTIFEKVLNSLNELFDALDIIYDFTTSSFIWKEQRYKVNFTSKQNHNQESESRISLPSYQINVDPGLERQNMRNFDGADRYYADNIHLGFVFASPLVYKNIKDLKMNYPLYSELTVPIGFSREFAQIMKGLQEKQGALRYRYTNATDNNLREVLSDKPIGLHFAMHGFKGSKNTKVFEKKAALCKGKTGDFLLFEKEDGSA